MLTNKLNLQTGLAGLLPIAFLHRRMTTYKIDEVNQKLRRIRAEELIQPEAIKRYKTEWEVYPKSYAANLQNYQRWYDNRLQELQNQAYTNE
jgi:uncharacterized protein YPO0396